MAQNPDQADRLTAIEQAVVELARFGLTGDTVSLRQYARRLLKSVPVEVSHQAAFREALGVVLTASPSLRRTAPAAISPADSESSMPLLQSDSSDIVTPPQLNDREHRLLEEFTAQRLHADALLEKGVAPPRTLLLTGAPGVGKSMTARYLADRLGLPLMTVDLAALMSSFLGRTGQNLRRVLDHARNTRCALLIDEFDALAKRRDDEADVGELKRIVNVLLLELERWPPTSVLIAATNHAELLDRAVGRRFDVRIDIELPDRGARSRILIQTLDRLAISLDPSTLSACAIASDGWSGSEIVRRIEAAYRQALVHATEVRPAIVENFFEGVRGRSKSTEMERAAFCAAARNALCMSNRAIAEVLHISHPTVARLLSVWDRGHLQGSTEAGI